MDKNYVGRVLRIAELYCQQEFLSWTVPEDLEVAFGVAVDNLFERDSFCWEAIEPSDVDAYEKACEDVNFATQGDPTYGSALYACRRRGMRPCNSAYPPDQRLTALFDMAGPERLIEVVTHTPGHRAAAELLAHPLTHHLHEDPEGQS